MYATQYNITSQEPIVNPRKVCAKYLDYPDLTGKRTLVGGLRTRGQFKQSSAQKPLLTVITVVYNRAHCLERCMQSILTQDYHNVEYIIIDGGSTDGTLDIIQKYQDAIDYYISEPDDGIYDAMNKGVSLAGGDFINFMSSDDYFIPDVFYEYAEQALHKNTIAIRAFLQAKDAHNKDVPYANHSLHTIFFHTGMNHPTFFIKNTAFEKLGYFRTEYRIAADYYMLLSLYMLYSTQIITIEHPTVVFSTTGISETERHVSLEEAAEIQWLCYGKKLGIPQEFFIQILSNTGIAQGAPLSELFSLYVKNTDHTTQKLWKQVFESFCYFLERGIHQEYYQLYNSFWHQFGQLSKINKVRTLLKKCVKRIMHTQEKE